MASAASKPFPKFLEIIDANGHNFGSAVAATANEKGFAAAIEA